LLAGCGWWIVLIYCERKLLLIDWWLVLVQCEKKTLCCHPRDPDRFLPGAAVFPVQFGASPGIFSSNVLLYVRGS